MKRRGFLKRLAGVATAAVVSERVIPDDGVALRSAAHPYLHDGKGHDIGFDLAPLKPEGATIPYDLCEESVEAACIEIQKRRRWIRSDRLYDWMRRVIDPEQLDARQGDDGEMYHLLQYKVHDDA